MALRVYPFGRRLGVVDDDQVTMVVQTITARLTDDDTLHMVHHNLSLWRDWCTPEERSEFYEMAQGHRKTVQMVHPPDVWYALERARPDLHAILSRNGGKGWLHTQAGEIKAALLRPPA
jgi:hypothetical protein